MKKIKIGLKEKIHFIGIGGIGMSGLAQVMQRMGFDVQGSDLSKNKNVERCKRIKIKVFLGHKKQNIKNILLDQKYISGIGNIYANEILFFSKINPNKLGKKINIREMKKLLVFSKKVLRKAIKKGGSTIRDFKNAEGTKGSFQDEFKVYNKDGFKCPNSLCAKFIKKITISNRSSFYCPDCQK